MRKITMDDTKDLLRELDRFIAKQYSAYVHGAYIEAQTKPRITMDEVITLQSKIRLITEESPSQQVSEKEK